MIWRRINKKARPAAWLAVFAVLLQLLLPVAQAPAGVTPPGLGGETIAGLDIAQNLCHSPGDVSPDNHGQAPIDHQQCCDVCLAVHAIGGFAPPSAPQIAISRQYGIIVPANEPLHLPRQQVASSQQARAPPVLI